jgi:hypothetical protein
MPFRVEAIIPQKDSDAKSCPETDLTSVEAESGPHSTARHMLCGLQPSRNRWYALLHKKHPGPKEPG